MNKLFNEQKILIRATLSGKVCQVLILIFSKLTLLILCLFDHLNLSME